ncbi:hypothetical protein BB558_000635 [Smittium angustum]|uniref:methylated diphthine methylhydrolase n=1 Tax=Smittium angustum TaxID=133377 RepID=A0A2U1JE08_SMIAN|nr:hypothetical protein BB558_000635 [Smittium angustum]
MSFSNFDFVKDVIYSNLEEIKQYVSEITLYQKSFLDQKVKLYNEEKKKISIELTELIESNNPKIPISDLEHIPKTNGKSNENQNFSINTTEFSSEKIVLDDIEKICIILFNNINKFQNIIIPILKENSSKSDADILGLKDKKAITQIIDFINIFGLTPKLLDGTFIPISKRVNSEKLESLGFDYSIFQRYKDTSNRIKDSVVVKSGDSQESNQIQLIEWIERFGVLAVQEQKPVIEIGLLVRQRMMSDLLSAILQTAYSPILARIASKELKEKLIDLKRLFTTIFNERNNTESIIESLFSLLTFSDKKIKWFRTLISRFLGRILMFPNGAILIMDFILGSESSSGSLMGTKLEHISNIFLTIPKMVSEAEYYSKIVPQLVQMIFIKPKNFYNLPATNNIDPSKGSSDYSNINYSSDPSEISKSDFFQTSIYILTRIFENNKVAFDSYALPLLAGPFSNWHDYKLVDAPKNNTNIMLDISTDESIPNNFIEKTIKLINENKTLENSGNIRNTNNGSKSNSPLIQVIEETATVSTPETKIKNGHLIPESVLKDLSSLVQVIPSNSEKYIEPETRKFEQASKENLDSIIHRVITNDPRKEHGSIEIISTSEQLEKSLKIIHSISANSTESSCDLFLHIMETSFQPILFLYQFIKETTHVITTIKNPELSKLIEVGSEKLLLVDTILKSLEELEELVLDIILNYFDLCSVTNSTTALKKTVLLHRLHQAMELQEPEKQYLYPLFALDSNAKVCLFYSFDMGNRVPRDSDKQMETLLDTGSNEPDDTFDSEGDMIESEHLWQMRIHASSLSQMSNNSKNSDTMNDVFASLFISILSEYSVVSEQIRDKEKNIEKESGKGIEILKEKNLIRSKNPVVENSEFLILKYSLLGQILLNYVEEFGPKILAKKLHVLAFVNTILSKSIDNPPPENLNNDPNDLEEQNVKEKLEKIFLSDSESRISNENQKSEFVDERISNSEELILALNLLLALCIGNLEPNQTTNDDDELPGDTKNIEKLFSNINDSLKILKKQWKSYPLVLGLVNQILDFINIQYDSISDNNPEKLEGEISNSFEKKYLDAMTDLQSPLVPIQAFGLINLSNLMLSKETLDSLEKNSGGTFKNRFESVLIIFIELLCHEDSFVYLKSIQALVKFSSERTVFDILLPILINKYLEKECDLDFRLRVGEVFVGISNSYGHVFVKYSDNILPMLLKSIEYSDHDSELIVHSSLSLLGIYCEVYPLAFYQYLDKVVECCHSMCTLPSYSNGIRRAAVVLLVSLVRGYAGTSKNPLVEMDVSLLRSIYETLKLVSNSTTTRNVVSGKEEPVDELLLYNARVGLNEIQNLISDFIKNNLTADCVESFPFIVDTTSNKDLKENLDQQEISKKRYDHSLNEKARFAIGMYELVEKDSVQSRIGKLKILDAFEDFESSTVKTEVVQEIDTCGIFDIKWSHNLVNDKMMLGQSDAEGKLRFYGVNNMSGSEENNEWLSYLSCVDNPGSEGNMCLSLDWSNRIKGNDNVKVCGSYSDGSVSVFGINSLGEFISLNYIKAHMYEAWITAFDYHNTNILYTGGGDGLLKGWDIREADLHTGTFVSKYHEMGVCSIQSNPLKENIVASGSYDEKVCVWDTRQFKKPISETNVGGGIWRLKWNPSNPEYLLAAAIFNGVFVLKHDGSDKLGHVSHFKEHGSLAYGADWSYYYRPRADKWLVSSCSFYDKACHFWNADIV